MLIKTVPDIPKIVTKHHSLIRENMISKQAIRNVYNIFENLVFSLLCIVKKLLQKFASICGNVLNNAFD